MTKAHITVPVRGQQLGFTLVELLLTIVVVAVLASVAVPNMNEFVLNSRLNGTTSEVVRTFQTARSESVKRQRSVVVCMSANPQAVQPTCATSNIAGWIMFQDDDNNAVRATTESLIETNTFETAKVHMLADQDLRVSFAPSGFAQPSVGVFTKSTSIVLCDSRGNQAVGSGASTARGIRLKPTGRVEQTRVKTEIDTLLGAIGGTCPP